MAAEGFRLAFRSVRGMGFEVNWSMITAMTKPLARRLTDDAAFQLTFFDVVGRDVTSRVFNWSASSQAAVSSARARFRMAPPLANFFASKSSLAF